MRLRLRLVAVALACAGLLSACGYEVVRYAQALGDVRRVAIFGFGNRTFEPGVDGLVTAALQREFLRRGALRLVEDPASADLVIRGVVADLDTFSRSFSSIQFSLEYEVRMYLEVSVQRRDGSEVLLDPRVLSEAELYLASADVEVARTNREEALRRLSTALAGRIHDALYERIGP